MTQAITAAMLTGLTATCLGLAAPASADEGFIVCPDGHSGVATTVTSCEFAHNVLRGYFNQGEPAIVVAYSPVTGEVYDMQCQPGFPALLTDGERVSAVRCVGGNDAVVVLF
ncbi:hypothetical protein BST37_08390 [Mycobacterium noviomagense]|uniref:Secreted protein n=1 Tax=Mycobacterium noviomagense TaxID=459858 RepID=A0ABX3T7C8_9MYCO|nr:hypothetical protein BST37_08390 [Mycobacterium noviomagense]